MRYDWTTLRANGSAANVPHDLICLSDAILEEDANRIYWRVDSVVVFQKMLFEASVPTTACVVTIVPTCVGVARTRMLELLVQLGSGEPDHSELCLGNLTLAQDVQKELERGFGFFTALLQVTLSDPTEAEACEYCIILLLLCALSNSELQERVRFYFETIIDKQLILPELHVLVLNSLAELRANN